MSFRVARERFRWACGACILDGVADTQQEAKTQVTGHISALHHEREQTSYTISGGVEIVDQDVYVKPKVKP